MYFDNNKIFTQHFALGYDLRRHGRNANSLIVGGSGSGKTFRFAKPNLMNCNTSFIVLDPKGENLRDTGVMLEENGYEIRVLDLMNMEKSMGYNPFMYLTSDNDCQRMVTNLFKATTPKGSHSSDPFWDQAAEALFLSLVFFLYYEVPKNEQTFGNVLQLLKLGTMESEETKDLTPLDMLMNDLEERKPHHPAVEYYKTYHSGAMQTLQCIQLTLGSKLTKFNLSSLVKITTRDELDLETIGTKRVALFCIIPAFDSSFNFLVSLLYTQLFQVFDYQANQVYRGALPVPVHFLMDEFANVPLPDDFDRVVALVRSWGVSVSIIIQNMAQIKALFEKTWESIVGNCDTFLYLGGNEQSSHKYVSELLGKETIDLNGYSRSLGSHGSSSTNYNKEGRELLSPDEVSRLDNSKCILFIRGERPILDDKYDALRHPNAQATAFNKAVPEYDHGKLVKQNVSFGVESYEQADYTEEEWEELEDSISGIQAEEPDIDIVNFD